MARYEPLTAYLRDQQAESIRLSFGDIERVLGRKLPRSAAVHRAFWSNNAANNVMTRAWLAAGFQTEQVDQASQTLVFRRCKGNPVVSGFSEAQAPIVGIPEAAQDKLALFGWMKGTITIASKADLTDPAGPDWAESVDEPDESPA